LPNFAQLNGFNVVHTVCNCPKLNGVNIIEIPDLDDKYLGCLWDKGKFCKLGMTISRNDDNNNNDIIINWEDLNGELIGYRDDTINIYIDGDFVESLRMSNGQVFFSVSFLPGKHKLKAVAPEIPGLRAVEVEIDA